MNETTNRVHFEHANPILRVADMGRALRYYTEVLGFANADWAATTSRA
jgi:catechol 2,3-dioxygenase-like lactoylglutathione lyase family enzyme